MTEEEIENAKRLEEAIQTVEQVDPALAQELRNENEEALEPNLAEDGSNKFYEFKAWRVFPDGVVKIVPNTWPEDCPLTPLGYSKAGYYFLNPDGDLLETIPRGQTELEMLFGQYSDYLYRGWPQNVPKMNGNQLQHKIKGYHAQNARLCLIKAAHAKGRFDARNKVRGRGCWRDDDGNLVMHVGDAVLMDGQAHNCGVHGEYIYPAREKMPRPIPATAADMNQLLEILKAWHWARPDKDPYLLMGWIGTAILTGALEWRPMAFIDGDAGAGKSTLQKTIRGILTGRLLETEDPSEASLRVMVGQDAMAVSFDEAEPDETDPERGAKIMKLARLAASGASMQRATKDQGVNEFILRGGMLFSAINIPKMTGADAQRFAFLKILPIPSGAKKFVALTPNDAKELGQKVAGRMVAAWPKWQEAFTGYNELLRAEGHSPRGADQFGSLLAAVDVMLFDEFCPERAFNICRDYRARDLIEYENVEANWYTCLRTILSAQPEVWRSLGFPSVGKILANWVHKEKGNHLAEEDPEFAEHTGRLQKKQLETAGLSAVRGKDGSFWLAIPNEHPACKKLFAGTKWAGGQWFHAIRHAPKYEDGEGVYRMSQVQMGGLRPNCTLINLDAKHDFGDGKKRPLFQFDEEKDDVES